MDSTFNVLELIRGLRNVDVLAEIQAFMDQGGTVLWWVMGATLLLWWLVLERNYYFRRLQPTLFMKIQDYWSTRSDHHTWYAQRIRQRLLSIAKIKAEKNLGLIKAVVVIAPLLGLLGTVTGMVDVFEALSSSSNTRAMAAGVSKATIPTMAGMVVAVIGVLFDARLARRAQFSVEQLEIQLPLTDSASARRG
jgi:biopolymer transport protein ExbB